MADLAPTVTITVHASPSADRCLGLDPGLETRVMHRRALMDRCTPASSDADRLRALRGVARSYAAAHAEGAEASGAPEPSLPAAVQALGHLLGSPAATAVLPDVGVGDAEVPDLRPVCAGEGPDAALARLADELLLREEGGGGDEGGRGTDGAGDGAAGAGPGVDDRVMDGVLCLMGDLEISAREPRQWAEELMVEDRVEADATRAFAERLLREQREDTRDAEVAEVVAALERAAGPVPQAALQRLLYFVLSGQVLGPAAALHADAAVPHVVRHVRAAVAAGDRAAVNVCGVLLALFVQDPGAHPALRRSGVVDALADAMALFTGAEAAPEALPSVQDLDSILCILQCAGTLNAVPLPLVDAVLQLLSSMVAAPGLNGTGTQVCMSCMHCLALVPAQTLATRQSSAATLYGIAHRLDTREAQGFLSFGVQPPQYEDVLIQACTILDSLIPHLHAPDVPDPVMSLLSDGLDARAAPLVAVTWRWLQSLLPGLRDPQLRRPHAQALVDRLVAALAAGRVPPPHADPLLRGLLQVAARDAGGDLLRPRNAHAVLEVLADRVHAAARAPGPGRAGPTPARPCPGLLALAPDHVDLLQHLPALYRGVAQREGLPEAVRGRLQRQFEGYAAHIAAAAAPELQRHLGGDPRRRLLGAVVEMLWLLATTEGLQTSPSEGHPVARCMTALLHNAEVAALPVYERCAQYLDACCPALPEPSALAFFPLLDTHCSADLYGALLRIAARAAAAVRGPAAAQFSGAASPPILRALAAVVAVIEAPPEPDGGDEPGPAAAEDPAAAPTEPTVSAVAEEGDAAPGAATDGAGTGGGKGKKKKKKKKGPVPPVPSPHAPPTALRAMAPQQRMELVRLLCAALAALCDAHASLGQELAASHAPLLLSLWRLLRTTPARPLQAALLRLLTRSLLPLCAAGGALPRAAAAYPAQVVGFAFGDGSAGLLRLLELLLQCPDADPPPGTALDAPCDGAPDGACTRHRDAASGGAMPPEGPDGGGALGPDRATVCLALGAVLDIAIKTDAAALKLSGVAQWKAGLAADLPGLGRGPTPDALRALVGRLGAELRARLDRDPVALPVVRGLPLLVAGLLCCPAATRTPGLWDPRAEGGPATGVAGTAETEGLGDGGMGAAEGGQAAQPEAGLEAYLAVLQQLLSGRVPDPATRANAVRCLPLVASTPANRAVLAQLQVTPAGPGHKGGAPEALPGVLLQWLGRETDPTALASLLSTVLSLSALRSVAVQLPAFAPPLLLNSKLDGTAFLREAALRIAARAVRLQPDCLALSDAKLNRRVAVVLGSSTPLAKAAGVAMFGALVSRPDLRDRNVAKLIASGAAKALLKILQVDHVAEDCPNLQPYAVALDALAGTEDGLTLLIGAECDVVLKLEQMLQVYEDLQSTHESRPTSDAPEPSGGPSEAPLGPAFVEQCQAALDVLQARLAAAAAAEEEEEERRWRERQEQEQLEQERQERKRRALEEQRARERAQEEEELRLLSEIRAKKEQDKKAAEAAAMDRRKRQEEERRVRQEEEAQRRAREERDRQVQKEAQRRRLEQRQTETRLLDELRVLGVSRARAADAIVKTRSYDLNDLLQWLVQAEVPEVEEEAQFLVVTGKGRVTSSAAASAEYELLLPRGPVAKAKTVAPACAPVVFARDQDDDDDDDDDDVFWTTDVKPKAKGASKGGPGPGPGPGPDAGVRPLLVPATPVHQHFAFLLDLLDCEANDRVLIDDVEEELDHMLEDGVGSLGYDSTFEFVEHAMDKGLVLLEGLGAAATARLTPFGLRYHTPYWDKARSLKHVRLMETIRLTEEYAAQKAEEERAMQAAEETVQPVGASDSEGEVSSGGSDGQSRGEGSEDVSEPEPVQDPAASDAADSESEDASDADSEEAPAADAAARPAPGEGKAARKRRAPAPAPPPPSPEELAAEQLRRQRERKAKFDRFCALKVDYAALRRAKPKTAPRQPRAKGEAGGPGAAPAPPKTAPPPPKAPKKAGDPKRPEPKKAVVEPKRAAEAKREAGLRRRGPGAKGEEDARAQHKAQQLQEERQRGKQMAGLRGRRRLWDRLRRRLAPRTVMLAVVALLLCAFFYLALSA